MLLNDSPVIFNRNTLVSIKSTVAYAQKVRIECDRNTAKSNRSTVIQQEQKMCNWITVMRTKDTGISSRSRMICSNWGKMIRDSGTVLYNRSIVRCNRSAVIYNSCCDIIRGHSHVYGQHHDMQELHRIMQQQYVCL